MEELSIKIGQRAVLCLAALKEGSGYDSDDRVIEELIFTVHELLALDSTTTQSTEVNGVLSTLTRFNAKYTRHA